MQNNVKQIDFLDYLIANTTFDRKDQSKSIQA